MTTILLSAPKAPRWRERVTTTGIVLMAVWALLAIAVVWAIARTLDAQYLSAYGGRIVGGFLLTIRLVVSSVAIGAVISIPVAAGRLSSNRVIGALAYAYSYFFRGTPLVAQLFLIYYGAGEFVGTLKAVGLWWFFRDATSCAILSFAMNTAAYGVAFLSAVVYGYIAKNFGYEAPFIPMIFFMALAALLWLRVDPTRPLVEIETPSSGAGSRPALLTH